MSRFVNEFYKSNLDFMRQRELGDQVMEDLEGGVKELEVEMDVTKSENQVIIFLW